MAGGSSFLSASVPVPRFYPHAASPSASSSFSACGVASPAALAPNGGSMAAVACLELGLQRHQGVGEAAAAVAGAAAAANKGARGMGASRPSPFRPMRPRQERTAAVDCSCGSFRLRPQVLRLATAGAKDRKRKIRASAALAVENGSARGTASSELAFAVGVEVIPHPRKVEKGGEDAYFVSTYGGGILGVADGVSGWAEENVDPALFAREFVAHAANFVATGTIGKDPKLLLQKAHESTMSKGAATACVAILERKGTLHIANLGDCGLRVVRQGRVVFATAPQQHYFDCPYQFSSEPGAQFACDAAVYHLPVMEGDTIVLGSDGLFDNVYNRDIESIVKATEERSPESAQLIANSLATLANAHSKDDKYESPYTREAISQGYDVPFWRKILGQKLTGGKLDDITVLVGHVVNAEILLPPPGSPDSPDDSVELSSGFSASDGGTNDSFSLESSGGSVSVDSPGTSSTSVDSADSATHAMKAA